VVANVVLVLVAALLIGTMVSAVRRRRRGLVAERGLSIGADLGTLADQPRVRIQAATEIGPDRVRLVLAPDAGPDGGAPPGPELEVLVELGADEFAYGQLQEWQRSQAVVAMVTPPGSRILRLRGIEDLQPLTLRRADAGPV
jgi:hypothetical protein